jgi:RNA polymerase subunit RPABC4/transcription elongation factor Spt4
MPGKELDLTPDPQVLIALTHTPLAPLDALCELVDNALDSFQEAKLRGAPVKFPLIVVQLPGQAEVKRGTGSVIVGDNGPGLPEEAATNALKAGFSGNKPRGRLGLFGMGFNIATGKLGQTTRFTTTQRGDAKALEVLIDLTKMQKLRSYKVPAAYVDRQADFSHGTIVEVRDWWPEGNANHGFIRKLVAYGLQTIREQLGRRYATILRDQGIRLLVGGEPCVPFEHCVWGDARSVDRRGVGKVPARITINEVIGTQTRCTECDSLIPEGEKKCPRCEGSSFRTVEERVRGWVGIQRFDDPTEFGIDLIRNGRAIRIGEKEAFFTFVDEFKRETKDYPIDSPYGRIVGEVHLDHVPVDFLKQDFQRSTDEWRRAMELLRGSTSLQPGQAGSQKNDSPIYMLFQGYRRVRTPGKTDLYMGFWDEDKPKRISREKEKEYYSKFREKAPGYYDDAEWWKLVEAADQPPPPKLVECPVCKAENLLETEICQACGAVLIGQHCINAKCGKLIPKSAVTCQYCGASQSPEIVEPWGCQVCGHANPPDAEVCGSCGRPRGASNPGSRDFLIANSQKDDALSIPGLSILLADGSSSPPMDTAVYASAQQLVPHWKGPAVPVLTFKGERMEVFLDKSHQLFRVYRIKPEALVAAELAQYLYDHNRQLLRPPYLGYHSISNLAWLIMSKYWEESLEDSAELVKSDIERFFDALKNQLARLVGDLAEELLRDLSEDEQRALSNNMLAEGQDLTQLAEWQHTGDFVRFVDPQTVVRIYKVHTALFFDGAVWNYAFTKLTGLSESVVKHVQDEIKAQYSNCLEDCAAYLRYRNPDPLVTQRARVSLNFLTQRLA